MYALAVKHIRIYVLLDSKRLGHDKLSDIVVIQDADRKPIEILLLWRSK